MAKDRQQKRRYERFEKMWKVAPRPKAHNAGQLGTIHCDSWGSRDVSSISGVLADTGSVAVCARVCTCVRACMRVHVCACACVRFGLILFALIWRGKGGLLAKCLPGDWGVVHLPPIHECT